MKNNIMEKIIIIKNKLNKWKLNNNFIHKCKLN